MINLIPTKRTLNCNGVNKEVHLLKLNPIHPMEFETVKKLIVERTTISDFEVGFVLGELSTIIIENLQQGRGVRLENLGTFEPSLNATAVDSANELNLSTVKKVSIIYKPSPAIKKALKKLKMRINRKG